MARSRKRTVVGLLLVAGVAVVLAGGLMASNMGFKLNYQLKKQAAGISLLGQNTLSLPYNRQVGINTAQDLLVDIGVTNAVEVDRYNKLANQYDVYSLANPVNYPLAAGEGYFVKANVDNSYIVVGSHDPSAVIVLQAPQVGVSALGQNLFAPPYHATAATAQDLLLEIGFTNVAEVDRYNRAVNQFDVYSLANPSNYPLVPGESYFLKMINTINYSPSHY